MDTLPPELIEHIILFLRYPDIVRLQLVSRRLLSISRDNVLWRNCCFERSLTGKAHRDHESIRSVGGQPEAGEARTSDRLVGRQDARPSALHGLSTRRRRAITNWDLSFPQEKIDWYQEYISRYGPISIGWLQQPVDTGGEGQVKREVLGMGLLRDSATRGSSNSNLVVAPLDDRSVCLWDVTTADPSLTSVSKGRTIVRSKPGLLASGTSRTAQWLHGTIGFGIVDCVSVDSLRKRAYFAVDNSLSEVDLETLQIIAETPYPSPISALSDLQDPTPLMVGTTKSLHIHDSRLTGSYDESCPWAGRCETTVENIISEATEVIEKFSKNSIYARLVQPGPVSIVHLAETGGNLDRTSIYVAGRFSSILEYDRRIFPRLRSTIYSGARLSALTSLGYPLLPNHQEDQVFNPNGGQQVRSSESSSQILAPSTKTLIACGEYKGKGSLELYGLGDVPLDSTGSNSGGYQNPSYKNRQTASSSKLLSVINHGTRLLFSDGDGTLKWMERDGFTEVRRWNINQSRVAEPGGLFAPASSAANGDVVRKILANGEVSAARAYHDELLLWTGERIALLNFATKAAFIDRQSEDTAESDDQALKKSEERLYAQTMRRALEQQADEVRFVQGLGLGTTRS
ncbi:MAG: hypothetical protein M1836_005374 [Candelina mexicana]|nr:MAG: hypothetical protein M1836_005374 [Candelina mexicana]